MKGIVEFTTYQLYFYIQEVNSVYRILSAILNTGNIEFTSTSSQHQSDKSEVPDSEALDNGKSFNEILHPKMKI